MFRTEEIQSRLNEIPFRPLRFIVSEGLRYDITHPDLVLVGQRDLSIGYPARKTHGSMIDSSALTLFTSSELKTYR